jgi:hypothetical protein
MKAIVTALALLTATVAHADEPWKEGVSPEHMAAAQKLLEAGNALFLRREFGAALAKYQEAVDSWNHPAIRFNMVRALIQLDRIVEAYDNLELALAYGAAPLDANVYNEAVSYQKLLAKQIANVVISCKQSGVALTFDGKPLLTCPGTQTRRVLPGPHQVAGKRDGYLTRTIEVIVIGGSDEHVDLALDPLGAVGKVTHRWGTWMPWTVVGAGVVVIGAGALVQAIAVSDHDRYYDRVARECSAGCDAGFASDLKDRAILENRAAIATMAVGGAALAVGGVLVYLNRARFVYAVEAHGASVGVRSRF